MDKPKVEKILRLMCLMSKKEGFSIDELAAKMETSPRTVYRYIDTLKDSGFVVDKVYGNVYRLVRIPSQYKDLNKLVYFSEEEARLLCNLIQGLDTTNTLKAGLGRKLSAVCEMTSVGTFVEDRDTAANVQALSEAITGKKTVVLRQYASANSGVTRDRRVEPFAFTTNYIDVWAYDVEDGENKLFKIKRIGSVVTEGKWDNESRHEAGFLDIFRMCGFSKTRVRIELSLRAKSLLCEEYPLAPSEVHQENDVWILDTMVSSMEGVGRFVVGLGREVTILEPQCLKEYVRDYAKDVVGGLEG